MSDTAGGVWEAVRRALGRLVSSVQVRDLAPASVAPAPRLGDGDLLQAPPCVAGHGEAAWAPQARTLSFLSPDAAAGGAGADLAAVAAVVGLNAALSPEAVAVHLSSDLATAVGVHQQQIGPVSGAMLTLGNAPVLFSPDVSRAVTCLTAPAVSRMPLDAPCLPKKPTPTASRSERGGVLGFPSLRVRDNLMACAEAPLVRARRPAPSGLRIAQAFAAERRQLAETAQAALDDVILLGVYPHVPVAAVRRLALEEDGSALSLWLKPDALRAAAQGRPPRFATLILGRQRSTGRMIQAVA